MAGKKGGGKSASARTGQKTTSLSKSPKLTQKNGKYPLTATWIPAGADAAHYTGSAASATFSLQSK